MDFIKVKAIHLEIVKYTDRQFSKWQKITTKHLSEKRIMYRLSKGLFLKKQ